MNYDQVALWLTNHPHFVGSDYQEDIQKLKGMYITNSTTMHNILLLCLTFELKFDSYT